MKMRISAAIIFTGIGIIFLSFAVLVFVIYGLDTGGYD
jgi:Na+-transporting methylmalonyl-CoA/oxaloacetate decarboxylase gamma subunit